LQHPFLTNAPPALLALSNDSIKRGILQPQDRPKKRALEKNGALKKRGPVNYNI